MTSTNTPNTTSSHKYRPEIDGLRTIAVLAVLIYHAKFLLNGRTFMQGGYLGVDIFFVISGFLITTILIRGLQAKTFSYKHFYDRRLRRLLPALLVVITASLPFAYLLLLPDAFNEFASSTLASIFFLSNIFFLSQDSYVAEPSLFKPLLHTWSLAIEEQFYIVFPIILAVVLRFIKSRLTSILVVLTLISFVLSIYQTHTDPDSSFFLLPFRFWELGVGAILASILVDRGRNVGVRSGRFLPAIGLILIVISLFSFDIKTGHPGFSTLLPVLGTALLIWYSSPVDAVGALLGSWLFRSIGKISYSLYLVHYPIFAFARVQAGGEPSVAIKLLALAATFLITLVIYNLIEKPFRYRLKARAFYVVIGLWALALIAMSIAVLKADGLPTRYNVTSEILSETFVADVKEQRKIRNKAARANTCYVIPFGKGYAPWEESFNKCNSLDVTQPNIIVMGDSTSAGLWLSLKRNYVDTNFIQISGSACGHNQITPEYPTGGGGACSKMWKYGYKYIADNSHKLSAVFITARHDLFLKMDLESLQELEQTTGVPIILFNANRQFKDSPHEFLAKQNSIPDNPNEFIYENLDFSDNLQKLAAHERTASELGLGVVDKASILCPSSRCDVVDADGIFLFYNHSHWTIEGGDEFARRLKLTYPTMTELLTANP